MINESFYFISTENYTLLSLILDFHLQKFPPLFILKSKSNMFLKPTMEAVTGKHCSALEMS